MKGLIKGQTLRFDAHDSGSGKPVSWGSGLHLHKIMNDTNKKLNKVEVLIPLDNEQELQFRNSYDKGLENTIKNEISNVLNKDIQKRKEFAQTLYKQIERFSIHMAENERLENLLSGADRIAKHFNLSPQIKEYFKNYFEDYFHQSNNKIFVTAHQDKFRNIYFIMQDIDRKMIKVGADLELLQEENLFKE
ncbi:MAG: hypothetical protein IT219_12320 [Bacteroidales bacterium]|nr:hypothetical protein [Bacteroidales bacterium]